MQSGNRWLQRALIPGVCLTLIVLALAMAQFTAAQAAPSASHYVYIPMIRRPSATPAPSPSPTPIAAGAFYVAPGGNDAGPGTAAQPWRTLGKAAGTLQAGQTVYLRAGTYRERVVPRNSGSAGKFITYAAYPGETVVIDGSGGLAAGWQGLFDVSHRSYIRVSGLTIANSGAFGLLADTASNLILEKNHTVNSGASGIAAWGGSSIVIDGNDVENSNAGGTQEALTVDGVSGFEITNNHVHNPGGAAYHKEGIDVKGGAHSGSVHDNTVDHVQAIAIYVDAWDQHTYDIDVYDNVVHDGTVGYVLASESGGLLENVTLYNNLAYSMQSCGFRTFGKIVTDSHPMRNIMLVNNTVYGSGCGIDVNNDQITGFTLRNNLLSQNGNQLQVYVSASLVTSDHNLIDGKSSGPCDNCVQGSPLFQAAAAANFSLQSGSPAVDRGMASMAPAVDCEGNPRPQGAGFDIGAYERMP